MFLSQLLVAWAFGASISAPVTFFAGAAVSSNSVLAANPNTATADGAATLSLIFIAQDAQYNALPRLSVNLTASGASNTFSAMSTTTDANGRFTTSLRSTVAQTETITASFDNSLLTI
jgi:hypothetical protein